MMVELRDATGAGEADILRAAIGLRVMRCTRDELGQVPLETCTARDGTVLPTATALTNLATHGQYRQFDHLMFRQDDYTEGSSRLTIRLTKKWAGYWETVCNEELLNSGLAKSDLVRDLLGDLYDRYRLVQRGYQPTVTVIAGNTQTQYGLFDLLGLKVRELV